MRKSLPAVVAVGLSSSFLWCGMPEIGNPSSIAVAWAASSRTKKAPGFRQEQAQVHKGRGVVARIVRDRRTPPQLKAQAEELARLLAERERYLTALETRRRAFLAAHRSEIDELAQLRNRAREIRSSLVRARKEVLDQSKAEIEALLRTSEQARRLTKALEQAYRQQRRERRSR